MRIVIFGSGPMPCEPQYPVLAPGARTWQIVQTAAQTLASRADISDIHLYGLETAARPDQESPLRFPVPETPVSLHYHPLPYERFVQVSSEAPPTDIRPPDGVDAVIGCASLQPCASATEFARRINRPLWIDLFGDPISELQTRAELHPDQMEANDRLYVHAARLLMQVLLHGDRFSALSRRHREAVIGQLGPAGRLGRRTRGEHLVHTIPYALFPPDLEALAPPPATSEAADQADAFTVMWCGSFNTWMDVDTLVAGLTDAFRQEPKLRLLVTGGRIAGYNDRSFDQFLKGFQEAGLTDRVRLTDWCSLEETRALYPHCNVGLSIDRQSYEALLGSRTRILNLLAAGKPVISTVVTELTSDLAKEGFVIPFRYGDAGDLAQALVETARLGRDRSHTLGEKARRHVADHYAGETAGRPMADWINAPTFARDKNEQGVHYLDNPLVDYLLRQYP